MAKIEAVETLAEVRERSTAATIEQQLIEIREQRAKYAAEKDARDQARAAADELDRERQALIDDEALAKLEAEHPAAKIRAVQTDLGLVVVKRPNAAEYKRFADKGDAKYATIVAFVTPCVLYPSVQRFSQMLEEQPGILALVSNAAIELAGVRLRERDAK